MISLPLIMILERLRGIAFIALLSNKLWEFKQIQYITIYHNLFDNSISSENLNKYNTLPSSYHNLLLTYQTLQIMIFQKGLDRAYLFSDGQLTFTDNFLINLRFIRNMMMIYTWLIGMLDDWKREELWTW